MIGMLFTPLGYINIHGSSCVERVKSAQAIFAQCEALFGEKPEPIKLVPAFAYESRVGYDNFMSSWVKDATAYVVWRRNKPVAEDRLLFTVVDEKITEATGDAVNSIRESRRTKEVFNIESVAAVDSGVATNTLTNN